MSRRTTVCRVSLLIGCSTLLFACGDTKITADFPLEVLARATGGEGPGVEGVTLKLNDQEIGQTDEDGRFEGTFHGEEGQAVTLEIIPPPDFRLEEGTGSTIKGVLAATRPKKGDPRPKTLSFVVDLKPTSIEYVALISAPGKFRPIYLGEELKGRTNALGVEVLQFRGRPGSTVEIRVDTTSKKNAPLLKKINLDEETRIFTLDNSDQLKEESEAAIAKRLAEAQEREAKALALLEEKAKKQGGKSAEKVQAVKATREQDTADAVDMAAVAMVSKKAADKVAAAAPKVEAPPPPPPTEEAYDKKKAAEIIKDVKKIVATVAKAKADCGKLGGKIGKLAKQPGGAAVAEKTTATHQAALAKLDQALAQAKAADTATAAANKAKDMSEINRQYQAAKLASADAEEALADANQAVTSASEEIERVVAAAKANEAQARAEASTAIEEAIAACTTAQTELKNLSKQAAGKIKTAKKGKKEAQGFGKEIDKAGKDAAKLLATAKGLKGKVKKAKPETLPDLTAQARETKASGDGLLAAGRASMAKLDDAITDKPAPAPEPVVAAATPTTPPPAAKKPVKKPIKPAAAPPKGKAKCPEDLTCELEALQSAIEAGEVDRCLVKVCEKVPIGGPSAEDIHLTLAKYWGRVGKRSRQLGALEKATSFGQYKYDPNVLYGYIKVAVTARRFNKAIEIKDRFMQVKERLPVEERKAKISEILSVLAQAYEHEFYQKQEKHEDQDFTNLLNSAIQFWEEYGAYSGDKAKSSQKIEALKKLREEMGP